MESLINAIMSDNDEVVEKIIVENEEHHRLDLTSTASEYSGRNILHIAIKNERWEATKVIIDKLGASLLYQEDNSYRIPLYLLLDSRFLLGNCDRSFVNSLKSDERLSMRL
jgi:hypothetical protein